MEQFYAILRRRLSPNAVQLVYDTLIAYKLSAISEAHADLCIRYVLVHTDMLREYDRLMNPSRPFSFTKYFGDTKC